MAAPTQSSAVLQCHPDTTCKAVRSINAIIRWSPGRVLTVTYAINGDIDQLRIPAEQTVVRTDELWQHTCFELFIGAKNDTEYYEFNFSPSGEWAIHEFRDYRDGGPINLDELDPKITVQRAAESFELSAVVRLDRLPGIQTDVYLSLGLSAVIEGLDGALSYWALKHPAGKPDIQHSDNFYLQIEPVVDGSAIDYNAKP